MNIFILIVVIIAGLAICVIASGRDTEKGLQQIPEDKKRLLSFGYIMSSWFCENMYKLALHESENSLDKAMQEQWNVYNAEDAIETLEWLMKDGHRSGGQQIYMDYCDRKLPVNNNINFFTQSSITETFKELDIVCTYLYKDVEVITAAKKNIKYFYLQFTPKQVGDVKSIAGWDYGRAAYLTRVFYTLGYITEEEGWNYLNQIADLVTSEFKDWDEYLISFYMGRTICFSGDCLSRMFSSSKAYGPIKNSEYNWTTIPFKVPDEL